MVLESENATHKETKMTNSTIQYSPNPTSQGNIAMQLTSNSFKDGTAIPGEFAFAVMDSKHHIALSSNRNPHLAWRDVPEHTKSFVLICHDRDVPSKRDDVNEEDREIPATLPRVEFFHWLLLDIPGTARAISAGSQSDGVVPRGKPGPVAPSGFRHGINDFTKWFAGDDQMSGTYYGYDGPCPPWNDRLLHHYAFTLYALDVSHLEVHGQLTGTQIRAALTGHVLGRATLVGTYSLNPGVR
jgi:Raf kinase inhibitor-like YbhB/YbcL family protein